MITRRAFRPGETIAGSRAQESGTPRRATPSAMMQSSVSGRRRRRRTVFSQSAPGRVQVGMNSGEVPEDVPIRPGIHRDRDGHHRLPARDAGALVHGRPEEFRVQAPAARDQARRVSAADLLLAVHRVPYVHDLNPLSGTSSQVRLFRPLELPFSSGPSGRSWSNQVLGLLLHVLPS